VGVDFPVSHDEEIGHALQGVVADLKTDLLVSQVRIGAEPLIFQEFLRRLYVQFREF